MLGKLPHSAPIEEWSLPPDLGGRVANFPKECAWQTPALMTEVITDWDQTILGGENLGAPDAYGSGFQFNGDVWSIQLTARPGYYVAPEIMEELGWLDERGPNG